MTPKGVEHDFVFGKHMLLCYVKIPMTPKGVEHLGRLLGGAGATCE